MKANELRIGNIIDMYFENTYTDREVVTSRTIFYCQTNPKGKFTYFGIMLTTNMLIDAGFKAFGKYAFTYKGVIIHNRKRGFVINKRYKAIIYVHQLQNLIYALTGEELEINL